MRIVFLTLIIALTALSLAGQTPGTATNDGAVNSSSAKPAPSDAVKDRDDSSQSNGYTRPDAETRRKRFINSTVGPFALGRQVATAGISTWRNSPEEWGTKWEGFGRRIASNFGKNAIKQSMKYGLDEAFKLDSHYYRSKNKSTGARIRNALISPVTARDRNGKRTIGLPNLVGTYGANIIAREAWYPDRYNWKDGVRSGTISLGFAAGFNLFKEFVWKK